MRESISSSGFFPMPAWIPAFARMTKLDHFIFCHVQSRKNYRCILLLKSVNNKARSSFRPKPRRLRPVLYARDKAMYLDYWIPRTRRGT